MPKQSARAQLGPRETAEVLDRFALDMVSEVRAYERGSRRSPKAIVRTLDGTYLLKRRAPGRDEADRIRFQHAVQVHLEQEGCPVAGLVRTKRNGNTLVRRGSRLYELFHFVEGTRCDNSLFQVEAAGATMARLHDACLDWEDPVAPGSGYHDCPDVAPAIDRIIDRIDDVEEVCRLVHGTFDAAGMKVNDLGWTRLARTIVHGDWHPGNVLFDHDEVAALLDFDSTRPEPRVSEFANGALQFAMRFGIGSEEPLPESMNLQALAAMQRGYDAGTFEPLENVEREMIPWLMIEALVVEGVVPIAMRGRFGNVPGKAFMEHLHRTISWIDSNHQEIINSIRGDGRGG